MRTAEQIKADMYELGAERVTVVGMYSLGIPGAAEELTTWKQRAEVLTQELHALRATEGRPCDCGNCYFKSLVYRNLSLAKSA